jgi:methyltransferase-like protein
MLSSVFGGDVAATLEEASPDLLHLEQYMDFVRNRTFRQTLLCHKALTPRRALTPDVLQGLLLSFRGVAQSPPDLASDEPTIFQLGPQRAEVKTPASKAAFALLMDAWPRAVDVADLCDQAVEQAAPFLPPGSAREARAATMADLLRAVMHGMIHFHTEPVACANAVSDRPRAHPLVAYQLATGDVVVNVHHEMIKVEPLGVEVLKLADGRRSRGEILDALVERAASGAIAVASDGTPVTGEAATRAILERELEPALAHLTRSALLIA